MPNRNLSTYQFEHIPGEKLSEIYAYEKGKKREGPIGNLSWNQSGMITSVAVHPDHQRLGLATEMHRRASKVVPNLHHAPEDKRTPDGKQWSKVVY